MIKPFKNQREGCNDTEGNDVTVHRQNKVTHAMLKRDHAYDVHACIPKLQGHHSQIRFDLFEKRTWLRHRWTLVSHISI